MSYFVKRPTTNRIAARAKKSIFSININAICLVAIVNKSNLLLAENEFFEVNFEAIILYAPANNSQLHLQKFQ